ncbi:hypothetical protein LZ32DRAFT_681040 [Colletotrichum eremochloae]|nr:hypothetical protein LZ32DRAFT_681040 [Colletotrichum eremochloae]
MQAACHDYLAPQPPPAAPSLPPPLVLPPTPQPAQLSFAQQLEQRLHQVRLFLEKAEETRRNMEDDEEEADRLFQSAPSPPVASLLPPRPVRSPAPPPSQLSFGTQLEQRLFQVRLVLEQNVEESRDAEEGEQADGPQFPPLDTPARPSIAQNGSRRASSVGGNPNLNMEVDGLQSSSVPLYFDDNGFDDDDDELPVDDGGGFYSPGGRNQAGNGEGDAAL